MHSISRQNENVHRIVQLLENDTVHPQDKEIKRQIMSSCYRGPSFGLTDSLKVQPPEATGPHFENCRSKMWPQKRAVVDMTTERGKTQDRETKKLEGQRIQILNSEEL